MAQGFIENLPYQLDHARDAIARVGLVVLASDYTVEPELHRILGGAGIEEFVARIEMSATVTPQTLAAVEQNITATSGLILPGGDLDALAYCCTSASVVLGEETVFSLLRKHQPQALMTTPITAAFAAFEALAARRIAVLTPYRRDVNELLKAYIEKAGFEVPVFASFNEERDPVVARIDERSIAQAIEGLARQPDVDLVFVSCTSVRMAHAVQRFEQQAGLPVLSSNLAMGWHLLHSLGVAKPMPQFGQLYTHQAA